MQLIAFFLLTFFSLSAHAIKCKTYERLADYLNTKKFLEISKEHSFQVKEYARKLKDKKIKDKSSLVKPKEPELNLKDINEARSVAFNFPAIQELGFGKPGGSGWSNTKGTLSKSVAYGKINGWATSNSKGAAKIRLDWDPHKGAHYNIEITQKNGGTHKLAITFLCAGKPCSEKQYQNALAKLTH